MCALVVLEPFAIETTSKEQAAAVMHVDEIILNCRLCIATFR